jgi:hypothetical protein
MGEDQESREQGAASYRRLAEEAEQYATKTRSERMREGYRKLADGWHELADQLRQRHQRR